MTVVEKPPRSNTLTYRVSHPSQYRSAALDSGNHHPHPVGFGWTHGFSSQVSYSMLVRIAQLLSFPFCKVGEI